MCQKTPVPTASPCTWSLWLDSNHRKFCTGKRRGLSLSPSAMLLVSETSWSVRYRCNMSHRYVLILFSEKGAGIAEWLSTGFDLNMPLQHYQWQIYSDACAILTCVRAFFPRTENLHFPRIYYVLLVVYHYKNRHFPRIYYVLLVVCHYKLCS